MADDIRFPHTSNSKQGPQDDRTAVAGGVAITVSVVLFIGWGIYFLHQVQSGAVSPTFGGGAGDQFNPAAMQQAQQALQQQSASTTEEFIQIRDESAQQQTGAQQMQVQQQTSGTDQFGNPTANY